MSANNTNSRPTVPTENNSTSTLENDVQNQIGKTTGANSLIEAATLTKNRLQSLINPLVKDNNVTEGGSRGFSIVYINKKGEREVFKFSLLPAISHQLSGSNFGNEVPEVKPGIMLKTVMRNRNIVVPGSAPIVQTIGIDNTVIELVGLFVGSEGIHHQSIWQPAEGIAGQLRGDRLGGEGNKTAYQVADYFNKQIVQIGTKCLIKINASENIEVEAIIVEFRVLSAQVDRAYYKIDALVVNYIQEARANPKVVLGVNGDSSLSNLTREGFSRNNPVVKGPVRQEEIARLERDIKREEEEAKKESGELKRLRGESGSNVQARQERIQNLTNSLASRYRNLATISRNLGRNDQSIGFLQKLKEITPNNVESIQREIEGIRLPGAFSNLVNTSVSQAFNSSINSTEVRNVTNSLNSISFLNPVTFSQNNSNTGSISSTGPIISNSRSTSKFTNDVNFSNVLTSETIASFTNSREIRDFRDSIRSIPFMEPVTFRQNGDVAINQNSSNNFRLSINETRELREEVRNRERVISNLNNRLLDAISKEPDIQSFRGHSTQNLEIRDQLIKEYLGLADIFTRLRNNQRAIIYLEAAIRLNPQSNNNGAIRSKINRLNRNR